MKKIIFVISALALFSLSACGETIEILEITETDANSVFDLVDDAGNLVEAE